jgi:hypothetical protein
VLARGIGGFAGDYSLAQAAKIPKALSEIIVAMISTVIARNPPIQFPQVGIVPSVTWPK